MISHSSSNVTFSQTITSLRGHNKWLEFQCRHIFLIEEPTKHAFFSLCMRQFVIIDQFVTKLYTPRKRIHVVITWDAAGIRKGT